MKGVSTAVAAVTASALLAVPEKAFACPYCYANATDSPITAGIAIAMGSLLVLVGLVGFGILVFFQRTDRRARLLEAGSTIVNEYGELVDTSD